MPTYEYVCSRCGHEFERFQSITEKPLVICPEDVCARKRWGRGKVKKKISAGAGLLFKGSGFYITDYRSESYKQAAKKESSAASSNNGAKSSSDSKSGKSGASNGSKSNAAPAATT